MARDLKQVYLKEIAGAIWAFDKNGKYVTKPGTNSLWRFHGKGEALLCLKKHGFKVAN